MAEAEPYYEVTQLDQDNWNIDKYECFDLIAVYKVILRGKKYVCNCPAGMHHRECKHIGFVRSCRQRAYAIAGFSGRAVSKFIIKGGSLTAKLAV